MKVLSIGQAITRRRLLRMNVALGLTVVLVAFVVNVTGEYTNLTELKAADTQFNYIALAGILYSASSFLFCLMSKPFWFPQDS